MTKKIDNVYQQDVYPIIRAFQSRKMHQFEHTDNREMKRLNMIDGWQDKLKIIPPLPEKHPALSIAQPPDPAFIAYVSLVDEKFQRDMRRELLEVDVKEKIEQHKNFHRVLEEEARAKAITNSIVKIQFTFDEIKEGLDDQIKYNLDKRYEIRDQWFQNQQRNVEERIEEQRVTAQWREDNYWHLRDNRDLTNEVWKHKKENALASIRFEQQRERDFEVMQKPNYMRKMMAFYNPTEIQMVYAAHQRAQNFMNGYRSLSAIDLPKYATGEAGIRTFIVTGLAKSS